MEKSTKRSFYYRRKSGFLFSWDYCRGEAIFYFSIRESSDAVELEDAGAQASSKSESQIGDNRYPRYPGGAWTT